VASWPPGYSVLAAGKLLFVFPSNEPYTVYKKEVLVHTGNQTMLRTFKDIHLNTSRNNGYYAPLNLVYFVNNSNNLIRVDISMEFNETAVYRNVIDFCFAKNKIYLLLRTGIIRIIGHQQPEQSTKEEIPSILEAIFGCIVEPNCIISLDDNTLMVSATDPRSGLTNYYLVDTNTIQLKGSLLDWKAQKGIRDSPVLWLRVYPRAHLPPNFPQNVNLVISGHSSNQVALVAVMNSDQILPINALQPRTWKGDSGIGFTEIIEGRIYVGMSDGTLLEVYIKFD